MLPCILQIHEFSRELINITEKDGKYVSGGFGSEIANATYPVPDKIKEAIIRSDLSINDNYPPLQQQFALLAKEIDEYAILAVAIGEHDDKGRPLIVYRYFWLEKPQDNNSNDNIDGIGTLILWWRDSKQPKFNFQNDSNFNNLKFNTLVRTKKEVYTRSQQNFGAISTENIAEIKSYPYIVVNNPESNNSYLKLHYLALHLQKELKKPLSWAWNVSFLDNPKHFTIIYCSNKHAYEQITSELQKHQKMLTQLFKNQTENNSSINNLENQIELPPPQDLEVKLKQILLDFPINDINDENPKVQKLLLFLDQHTIRYFNPENIIDKQRQSSKLSQNEPFHSTVIYRAILVLLGFEDLYEWLNWLNETSKINFDKSLQVQNIIVELSRRNAYYQIKELVFDNISNLLLQCSALRVTSKKYKLIHELLLQSSSIWSSYFKPYTQLFIFNLINNTSDSLFNEHQFFQQLYSDLRKYKNSRENQLTPLLKHYYSLALLIKKLGNNSLSALFYQLSEGAVPKEVYYRTDVQIIPLARKQTIHPVRKIGSFIRENGLIITILLFIFVGVTGVTWVVTNKNLPQWQEKFSNW